MTLNDRDVERLRGAAAEATFHDRFELVREADAGAMGRVFEAIDRESHQRVAVKLLAGAGDRARFAAEAEILERLDHPAIVRHVRHGFTDRGEPYLAMEWLVGETLASRLARGPLAVDDALVLGARLADALDHAHAAGVVHRDLKPSNVVLVDGEVARARLIDFGVAKTADHKLTRSGEMIGTPGYMAPELVRGESRVSDRRVDLFALGCVLYEALAGRRPFEGDEIMEVLARVLLDRPPAIATLVPSVPPRLARLIGALLAKTAARRVGDARRVHDELVAIRAGIATGDLDALERSSPEVPVQSREDFSTVVSRAPAAPRRRWPPAALVAAAGVVAVTVVLYVLAVRDRAPAECSVHDQRACAARCDDGNGEACWRRGGALAADPRAAIAAYERGCELRHGRACYAASSLVVALVKQHAEPRASGLARAERLLALGCDARYAEACRIAGVEHLNGGLYGVDGGRALAMLGRACELNSSDACAQLDVAVAAELGSEADRATARAIYAAACARKLAKLPCGK